MKPRLFPFVEELPQNTSTASLVNVTWRQTVYKPNPFHGVDRWLFAFDEWGHRTMGRLWHRWPMRTYCAWWDRRLNATKEKR